MSSLCFKHQLDNDLFFTVGIYMKQVVFSFRYYKQYTENGKWYPTKKGITFNQKHFDQFTNLSTTIVKELEDPKCVGKLLDLKIGNKWIRVFNDYAPSDDNTCVVLESIAFDDKHRVRLPKDIYMKFVKFLPDFNREVSVAIMFDVSHTNE